MTSTESLRRDAPSAWATGRVQALAVLLVLLIGSSAVMTRGAVAGVVAPDPGFGRDGFVTFDFGGTHDWARAVVLQPDGKTVVGGWAYTDHTSAVVARLNSDGSLDRSFADGGIFRLDPGGIEALLMQPDGKIIAVGAPTIRLTPDGRLDTSFGDNGILVGDINKFSPIDAALDGAGRIVVAGTTSTWERQTDIYLARYSPSGTLDTSFGDQGRTVVDTGSTPGDPHYDNPEDLVALDDGSYVVVGATWHQASQLPVLVVRFTASGALDQGFDGDGYKAFQLTSQPSGGGARAALADTLGRVDVAVMMPDGSWQLIRMLPNGELDRSFGTGARLNGGAVDLARDPAGRIIAASGNSLSRYTAQGQPDRSFNYATTKETPEMYDSGIFGEHRYVQSTGLAVAPDGAIIVGGFAQPTPGQQTAWGNPDHDWYVQKITPIVAGYWMLGEDGKIYAFGDATHYGDATAPLAKGSKARALAATPDSGGYWIVTDRGAVFGFGNAAFHGGNPVLTSGEMVTSLSSTPTGRGYWLFSNRGRAFAYGDARLRGDMAGVALNGGVLGSVSTPAGNGYYMIASDGGVFSFGDATFAGSMGGKKLNAPVQSLVPESDGDGYWLVASDGGIFAFEAPFRGSMGAAHLNRPVIGMVRYGTGYLMVASDGGIFNFSDRPFVGSLGDHPPAAPIVGVAVVGRT